MVWNSGALSAPCNREVERAAALGPGKGDAAAPAGTVGYLGGHGESTEFEQEFAETRAFFEVHIDKFKSHGLRASAADKGLRFDGAHTVRKLESEQRAGRKMTFPGATRLTSSTCRNVSMG